MLIDYINYVLSGVGLPQLMSLSELMTYYQNITEWSQVLNPQVAFSSLALFSCCWAIFSIICILPFRLFKKLINYPSRKRCEK